ncbi:MAG: 1-deoxy-D-xylulose-5-phosphate synthase [Dehalococcoidia bacterium]|nr:1-deoxy-D-xylulose-5-phosphate synthase [Dehalococcoidia bacterium]
MTRILNSIDSPSLLKGLSYPELEMLGSEIREELITRVPLNGGHLASNLGVVELTIALHRVFDSPSDKVIWDVGHQSYVHKLLTGRRDRFTTIRQYGGLSGFTDRSESVHDAFGAGHASTSISAALGMAIGRDLSGGNFHVIAVIGDGALTGGMAIEALNHCGHLGTRIIVILNDNGMAISPNVGAFSRVLTRMRLDLRYEIAKKKARKTVTFFPWGKGVWSISKRMKSSMKRALLPGAMWEEFGFTYVGPVNGHDIRELEAALIRARDFETTPTIVHVLTRKGKGHPPAEADAATFHGLAPSCNVAANGPSYSSVFGKTVSKLMKENEKVVAISAAMLDGTGLARVSQEFPHRVFDVGICEQHAVTLAGGLACQGYIPIVAIYSTFLQRAYDQVLHDICIQDLPVTFALDRAGLVGDDGKTHQGLFDISYLSSVPNMIVAAPKDEDELQHMLYTSVHYPHPMAIRYPRGSGPGARLSPEFQVLPVGKAELLKDGGDIAILAIGSTVHPALGAAGILESEGISCAVVNARFAKPLDSDLILELASRTRRVLTVEENTLSGGFGSAVAQLIQSSGCTNVTVACMGTPDEYLGHGPQDLFRTMLGLDADGIAERARSLVPRVSMRASTLNEKTPGL